MCLMWHLITTILKTTVLKFCDLDIFDSNAVPYFEWSRAFVYQEVARVLPSCPPSKLFHSKTQIYALKSFNEQAY